MKEPKGIPIKINDYYIVGYVVGDEFRKRVKGHNHFLRKPPSIAFNVETLEDAYMYGARIVHVHDTDTKTDYYATITNILENGFRLDRGFGPQVALPLPSWSLRRPSETQMDMFAERSENNYERQ